MHLGYHELRNMLKTFREEREKRKKDGSSAAPVGPPRSDYRPRDEYRDRDRGYERGPPGGSSRYE